MSMPTKNTKGGFFGLIQEYVVMKEKMQNFQKDFLKIICFSDIVKFLVLFLFLVCHYNDTKVSDTQWIQVEQSPSDNKRQFPVYAGEMFD